MTGQTPSMQPAAPAGGSPVSAPDLMHRAQLFFEEHKKRIGLGVLVLALIAFAIAFNDFRRERAKEKAQADLGLILVQADSKARLDALTQFLERAPEEFRPAVLLEMARASQELGDFNGAIAVWDRLAALSQGTHMELWAKLGASRSALLAGQADEALQRLDALKPLIPDHMKSAVLVQVAAAAEAGGQWEKALAAYQELMSPDSPDAPYLEHKISELRAKLGKKG